MTYSRAYLRTQQETASKERLMVMLFEAELRHMRNGATALEGNRSVEGVFALTKASDIVVALGATLDHTKAPELCQRLADVYNFVSLRLTRAAAQKDSAAAREAERAFAPLAEAFGAAVAQLASTAAPEAER